MTERHYPSTASSGVIIEREYRAEDAAYEETVIVGGSGEVADEAEPMLDEPIDHEAELAERRETHEPIEFDSDADLTNTAFGI